MPLVCRHGPFSWNGTMRRRVSSAAIWERLTGPYQPASLACFVYLSRLSKKLRRNSKLSLNSASSSRSPTRWSTRPGRLQSSEFIRARENRQTGLDSPSATSRSHAPRETLRSSTVLASRTAAEAPDRARHRLDLPPARHAISSGSINGMVERTRGVSLVK